MGRRETGRCCLRKFYDKNRIAVEFFHSVADGRGGSVYLRNLTARYLALRHGLRLAPDGVFKDLS